MVEHALLAEASDVETEDDRQDALRSYDVLDEHHPSRPAIRGLLALAAQASGGTMATINLLTEDHQHQIETVGFEGTTSARSDSMCAVVVDESAPVVLEDARDDPRFADNPWVTGPAAVRFYATFQLRTPAKVAIGSLCIFDSAPRTIDQAQQDALSELAAHVMDVLELELQRRLLDAANRRLAAFAATVSHELRGPLGTVQLALDLAGDAAVVPGSADTVTDLLDRALRATDRMADSVDHLLRTAKHPVVAGTGTATGVPVSGVVWNELVAAAVEDLGPELDGIDLEATHADTLVGADATGLRLALQNLLTNAARYARPTDPRVRLHLDTTEQGWTISVVDHGPGVPADERDGIFTSGVRGSVAGSSPGAGIGLATSRQLVDQMGGTLAVHETTGGGATFVITLPDRARA